MSAAATPRPSDAPIGVLLVDDYGVLRNGLRMSLQPFDDIEVVGEAPSGPAAVTETIRLQPDVVLMDLRMPGGDGVTATREIVASGSRAAVLVLTTYDADEDVHAAIDAGAAGYLLKDQDPDHLAAAIRTAATGEYVLAGKVVRTAMVELRRRAGMVIAARDDNPLSAREVEILLGMAAGLTNQEIARQLVMEPSGVKSAVERMLAKHAAKSRAQLVAWAFRNRYLS